MDNPGAALPGWCSASGRLSRSRQLKRSARRLSDVGLGTSGTGAERSREYRFNPCENRLTPRQNAQQIPDEREVGTRPSFHHVRAALKAARYLPRKTRPSTRTGRNQLGRQDTQRGTWSPGPVAVLPEVFDGTAKPPPGTTQ